MSLHKKSQSFLGILSVVALSVFGTRLYVLQQGSIASQADVVTDNEAQPSVSLAVSSAQLNVGASGLLTISGNNFSTVPVTRGTLAIAFPPNLIAVTTVTTDGGVLDTPYSQTIDNATGLVILTFLPPAGVTTDGSIAKIGYTALQPGSVTFSLITGQPEPNDTTGFTTLSDVRVPPLFLDTSFTIL